MQATWLKIVKQYQKPDARSIRQILNSFIPFFALWVLMYYSLGVSYWITLALAFLAAGFVVRIFIIQHDCGHGSFFKKKSWNSTVGFFCSLLTLTPYEKWQYHHAMHHAHSSNLDHRGYGDIYTMTLDEYLAASPFKRWQYRLFRNPWLLFSIVPTLLFVIWYRVVAGSPRERRSTHITNLALLAILVVVYFTMDFQKFLLVQLPITVIASTAGVWLFYIQHQFEDTYWEHDPRWQYKKAAMEGSSYLKLPKVLQWFTGNIGFHHIHHLSPLIPNYRLEEAYTKEEELRDAYTVSLLDGIKVTFADFHLWDEKVEKLVGFKYAHQLLAQQSVRN